MGQNIEFTMDLETQDTCPHCRRDTSAQFPFRQVLRLDFPVLGILRISLTLTHWSIISSSAVSYKLWMRTECGAQSWLKLLGIVLTLPGTSLVLHHQMQIQIQFPVLGLPFERGGRGPESLLGSQVTLLTLQQSITKNSGCSASGQHTTHGCWSAGRMPCVQWAWALALA